MNHTVASLALALLLAPLTGCAQLLAAGGMNAGPGGAPASEPATGSEPGAPSAPASPETAAAPAPEEKPSEPVPISVTIRSECSKTTRLFLGDKPKYSSGKTTTLGGNTTMSEGRKNDGTLKVWLVDEKDEALGNVFVTRETKKVVVGSNCTSIKAE